LNPESSRCMGRSSTPLSCLDPCDWLCTLSFSSIFTAASYHNGHALTHLPTCLRLARPSRAVVKSKCNNCAFTIAFTAAWTMNALNTDVLAMLHMYTYVADLDIQPPNLHPEHIVTLFRPPLVGEPNDVLCWYPDEKFKAQ
jgi:hypothetical protein